MFLVVVVVGFVLVCELLGFFFLLNIFLLSKCSEFLREKCKSWEPKHLLESWQFLKPFHHTVSTWETSFKIFPWLTVLMQGLIYQYFKYFQKDKFCTDYSSEEIQFLVLSFLFLGLYYVNSLIQVLCNLR